MSLIQRYRLRWKRRRFLFRCWRKRRQLTPVVDRTDKIADGDILAFVCLRNEALRLPYFLSHMRALGVAHFLIVDNGSTDGSTDHLTQAADVSLWRTGHSYRLSRFGMDWLGWLQIRHGHGHWCLTVDVDELLVFPGSDQQTLMGLTQRMAGRGQNALGVLLLDLYPDGPLSEPSHQPGDDPTQALSWFDASGYRYRRHYYYGNAWIQGGPRDRVFFEGEPARAPTLNKFPLIKWDRRFVYVNSTHQVLPARLHDDFDPEGSGLSGALLHTKFLPDIASRSAEEQVRAEHFQNSELYSDYYERLIEGVTLHDPDVSERYEGPGQLVRLGLMRDDTARES